MNIVTSQSSFTFRACKYKKMDIENIPYVIDDKKIKNIYLLWSISLSQSLQSVLKDRISIFIFSKGSKNSWKEIKRKDQKMIWMSLTPNTSLSEELNSNTIDELINLIKKV